MSDKEKKIIKTNKLDSKVDKSKPNQESRRKAVRKMLAGGGIATGAALASNSKWSKPILNTVVLPAHGQMSSFTSSLPDCSGSVTGTGTGTTTPCDPGSSATTTSSND